jgi:methionyl-tRNA formyltransferase
MKISILCSDPEHPVNDSLQKWQAEMSARGHAVSIDHEKANLPGGDLLFLVSCSQIIREQEKSKYKATLVLHASDLPLGRGWSPHIWAILNGENNITVSLLEADDPVDSGAIWYKTSFSLQGHELLPEINQKLFAAELQLMTWAVAHFPNVSPIQQQGDAGEYMPKRTPADSRLDPDLSIADQFNLLRVVDSERYPAFFEYLGKKYLIRIEKTQDDQ